MNRYSSTVLALAATLFWGELVFSGTNDVTLVSDTLLPPPENQPVILAESPVAPSTASFLLHLILTPQADIRERLEAAQELGGHLSRSEVTAFYGFLKGHPDANEQNLAGLRTLKNNLINALKDQDQAPIGLTATLIDMFYDRGQDYVCRDYAIQHLTSWYTRSGKESPDAGSRILITLKEALRENTGLAGTALLGLHQLSLLDRAMDGSEIDRSAVDLATSADTVVAVRITALQICADRGLIQALPEIKHCAQERGQTALQISAIAALGKLGNAEDVVLLRKLEDEDHVALQPAIDAALKRLPPTLASRGRF